MEVLDLFSKYVKNKFNLRHFCQVYPAEAPNSTNIDEVIKQATANDPELLDINLNNLKYISKEKWSHLFDALKENNVVESLSACNCDLTDTIANLLCECLEVNKVLKPNSSECFLSVQQIHQSPES